jgi:hypothetical protein
MQTFQASQSFQALAMLSRYFVVRRTDAPHPSMEHLGRVRVVSVVLNHDQGPEVCLLADGHEQPYFYWFDRLEFQSCD